jgi:hypothetical protein
MYNSIKKVMGPSGNKSQQHFLKWKIPSNSLSLSEVPLRQFYTNPSHLAYAANGQRLVARLRHCRLAAHWR